jgi:hypothetical protein
LEHVSTREILGRTASLVREDLPVAGLAILLLSGLGIALDLARGSDGSGAPIVDSAVGVVAQFWITRHLVARNGLGVEGRARGEFQSVFGACLLSGLAILFGLLLLVVPGIFLWIRWFAAVPLVVARGERSLPALRASWEMTKGSEGAILAATAVIYAPMILMLVLAVILLDEVALSLPVFTVVTNLVLYTTLVTGWYAAVAFFELREPTAGKLEQVFA